MEDDAGDINHPIQNQEEGYNDLQNVVQNAVQANANDAARNNGYTITKTLTNHDTKERLWILKTTAEGLLLAMGLEDLGDGVPITIFDPTNHQTYPNLTLTRYGQRNSCVLCNGWNEHFVGRRNLKPGDKICLAWDNQNNRLQFSVVDLPEQ